MDTESPYEEAVPKLSPGATAIVLPATFSVLAFVFAWAAIDIDRLQWFVGWFVLLPLGNILAAIALWHLISWLSGLE